MEAVGTSGSAMVMALLASGKTVPQMESLMRTMLPSRLLDWNLLPFGGTAGAYTGNKMLETLRQTLPKTFEETKIPLHVVAHNWTRNCMRIFEEGDLPLAIRTSMSLPIFNMVRIGTDLYEDGGVSANAYFDFTGWKIQTGIEKTPTIAFKVRGTTDGTPRRDPFTKIDRLVATTEDIIDSCDREHIHTAIMNKVAVVFIDSKFPALKLDITEKDVDLMMAEGEAAVEAAFVAGALG